VARQIPSSTSLQWGARGRRHSSPECCSSSLKFSVFLDAEPPRPLLSGHIEELLTHPRFEVRDASGNIVDGKVWETGINLDHDGAIEFILGRGRRGAVAGHRIAAAGHRVVHGGTKFIRPVVTDADTQAELEKLVALAPLQQPHNLAAIRAVAQQGAAASPGGLLRHVVPSNSAMGRRGIRVTAPLYGRRGATVRISRIVT